LTSHCSSLMSQVDQLTIFPFPGLKIINIRGNALLTLDLIIINHFVTRKIVFAKLEPLWLKSRTT